MSVLHSVVETGSLSAAGRRLGIPLSTVSRKVSDLEANLGARLLVRSTRSVTLTEAGKAYVIATRRILEGLRRGGARRRRRIRGREGRTGDHRAHRVRAPAHPSDRHGLPRRLSGSRCQAGPRRQASAPRGRSRRSGPAHRKPVRQQPCRREGRHDPPRGLRQSGVETRGAPQNPSDLAKHDVVTFPTLAPGEAWTFGKGAAARSIPLRSRLSVNTAEAAIDAAIAGLGLTRVLSYQIATAVAAGRLVTVLQDFAPDPVPVSLVYPGQGMLPLKLRAFLDFAAPRLRAGLQGPSQDAPGK